MVTSFLKICFPRLSFRKLVPLAIDGPDIAPARYPIKPLLILLSNTTGSFVDFIFLDLIVLMFCLLLMFQSL